MALKIAVGFVVGVLIGMSGVGVVFCCFPY